MVWQFLHITVMVVALDFVLEAPITMPGTLTSLEIWEAWWDRRDGEGGEGKSGAVAGGEEWGS